MIMVVLYMPALKSSEHSSKPQSDFCLSSSLDLSVLPCTHKGYKKARGTKNIKELCNCGPGKQLQLWMEWQLWMKSWFLHNVTTATSTYETSNRLFTAETIGLQYTNYRLSQARMHTPKLLDLEHLTKISNFVTIFQSNFKKNAKKISNLLKSIEIFYINTPKIHCCACLWQ